MKKFYLTVSIPYVNSTPHIGYALEVLQADVFSRYYRAMEYDTYFLSGSDDNALKNVQAAESAGMSTKEFVDKNASAFAELKTMLNLTSDQFFQTSTDKHFKGAQKLWSAFDKNDLYKKSYEGYYCVGCEAFYTEKDLINDHDCPIHKKKVDVVHEENWFFRLSDYQDKLLELIETDQMLIQPEFRKNEMISFIKSGLEDLSVSRSIQRSKGWGVPVPGDETQIMYVWVDALSNYITGLGYGSDDESLFRQYWPASVHMIGKDIARFHTIYWPAFLMSAKLPVPRSVNIHGFITVNGEKMSKSIGNVLHPRDLVSKYGLDATRYYLLREIPTYNDGDFSTHRMEEIYSADLANSLGNLVSRTIAMIQKYNNGKVPTLPQTHLSAVDLSEADSILQTVALDCIKSDPETSPYGELIRQRDLSKTLEYIWRKLTLCNQLINATEPWKLYKNNEIERTHEVLYWLAQSIHTLAWEIYPFLPDTSIKIAKAFAIHKLLDEKPNMYHGMHEWEEEAEVQSIEILFPALVEKH